MLPLFIGFFLGAILVLGLEAAAVFYLINLLTQKARAKSSSQSAQVLDSQQSLDFAYNKQGFVWVLESEKLPNDKLPKEPKRKKDILEVYPVRKYAKIKDRTLHLKESDGSQTAIPLKGCVIEAVSGSTLPSRKWAKRFPIKVESKTSTLYNLSKTIYIYLETSWEKESWCKAFRLAACDDKKRLEWCTRLNEEFHCYLTSLNTGYPSFTKPSIGLTAEPSSLGAIVEPIDRSGRFDGSSSKVRILWKKLAKKASKPCMENKPLSSNSGRVERKVYDKFHTSQDSVLGASSAKSGTTKVLSNSGEENDEPLSSMFRHLASQSQITGFSDTEADDKFITDEATLCCNLLIFRLFFDAKSHVGMKNSLQARIQKTLSSMRTPSYIGEIICKGIDIGNIPPHIHGMRVLPMDMHEVWAFEVDFEYSGGVVLNVETRLEVRELDANSESSSVGDVSADLLEGFEYYGKQLNISERNIDEQVQKDGLKNNNSPALGATSMSRWKCILNSIAKQVSQVPLSLSIQVASLRGTVCLHIKPPPSDQLWFGFTSMPDIDFNLESGVGDHKITSGRIADFLINRFKMGIQETMVLPNRESVCIPWMLAEKDDWVQRSVAPFMWLNQEASSDHTSVSESFVSQSGEAKTKTEATKATSIDHPESKHQSPKNIDCVQQSPTVPKVVSMPLTASAIPSIPNGKSLQELKTPLLESDVTQETGQQKKEEIPDCQSPPRSLLLLEKKSSAVEEDDSRPKKGGRKARMLDLGKKMGEKFEEKRRHIEEKSRHIVEKMRGP
ncbi:uncharacterized protein LOC123204425 isoform X2 [Mangifera indica]|uniref:uncharacterized protein LOC123204425 isoform X2 n=1 Tax=Mangifera indica TaxID=29780 RepID=UPI001CFAB6FD|nr:uncharacterized protein LOC123204425 isoform X2 [Mangifera indica]